MPLISKADYERAAQKKKKQRLEKRTEEANLRKDLVKLNKQFKEGLKSKDGVDYVKSIELTQQKINLLNKILKVMDEISRILDQETALKDKISTLREVSKGHIEDLISSKIKDTFTMEPDDMLMSKSPPMDPFGLLSAPVTTHLADYDYTTLTVDHYKGFMDKVSMISSDEDSRDLPSSDDMTEDKLDGGNTHSTEGIPHIVHAIWLGGPLMDKDFRKNFSKAKSKYPGWAFNLWSNVPRKVIKDAAAGTEGPAMDKVRDFISWAKSKSVNVINVDEVFSGGNSMSMEVFYKVEENKKVGVGYAACSDMLRIEILKRFGGVYLEGDNTLGGDLESMLTATAGSKGKFRAAEMSGRINNSSFITNPGNPLLDKLLEKMTENYDLTQRELVGKEKERITRSEVIKRTGPTALLDILKASGIKGTDLDYRIPKTDIVVESASSWYTNSSLLGVGDPDEYVNQDQEDLATAVESMKDDWDNLSAPEEEPESIITSPEGIKAIETAVEKAITFLLFEFKNKPKHLDLDVVERQFSQLEGGKGIARKIMLETLSSDDFKPIAQKIETVSFPKSAILSEEMLDLLFSSGKFPNLNITSQANHEAIVSGQNYIFKYALDKGFFKNKNIEEQNTFFIESGFDSARAESRGGLKSVVYFAIEAGNKMALLKLIEMTGFKFWIKKQTEENPLFQAIFKKQYQMAAWLLEAGAPLIQGEGTQFPFTFELVTRLPDDSKFFGVLNKLIQSVPGSTKKALELTFDYVSGDQTFIHEMMKQRMFRSLSSTINSFNFNWELGDEHPFTEAIRKVRPGEVNSLVRLSNELKKFDLLFDIASEHATVKIMSGILNTMRSKGSEALVGDDVFDVGAAKIMAEKRFGKKVEEVKDDYSKKPDIRDKKEVTSFCYKGLSYALDHLGEFSGSESRSAKAARKTGWTTALEGLDLSKEAVNFLEPLRDHAVTKLKSLTT